MYTPQNKISALLVRYLKDQLDEIQEQELAEWLKESRNQKLFDRIVEKERILDKCSKYDTFDKDKAWAKIDQQILNRRDYRKWLSYAAVLLLPLAVGFFILYQTPEYEQTIAQFQEIKPGETNAKLYFSNGDVVDLKGDTSSVIRAQDNLVVKKDSKQLQFNSDLLLDSKLNHMNRIVTPIGGEYQVELPDGTKVWLNADSYLEFPSKFSEKQRKVTAKGELYFDVAKNKDWPFIVESKGMELKVLGTEFNLRAYNDENEMVSTLVEGSVIVSNSVGNQVVLSPGMQVSINKSDFSMQDRMANVEEVTSWKNGKFIFENRRIEDIMYDMSRWYDVKVFFGSASIKEKRFSVDVPRYGKIESILTLIEGTGEVSFTINKNVITVK